MAPMRETQRRRLLTSARRQALPIATAAIYRLLDRRYKEVKRDLRRANLRKRLARNVRQGGQVLRKDDMDWQQWAEEFSGDIEDALAPLAEGIWNAEEKYWLSRSARPAPVDPMEIVRAYELRTGRQISGIADDTQAEVMDMITAWYNTDAGMPELIDQLGSVFSEARAEMIARTEASYISSQVSIEMMGQFGIKYWNWDLGDEVGGYPCEICLAMADSNPHTLDDPMPPDASHPNCRCGIVYATEEGDEFIYG